MDLERRVLIFRFVRKSFWRDSGWLPVELINGSKIANACNYTAIVRLKRLQGNKSSFVPAFFINRRLMIFAQTAFMIQRIQSIYLLAVAISGILMYFFPLVSLVPSAASASPVIYHLSALQVEILDGGQTSVYVRYWPSLILNAFIVAFSVYTILQFRKRPFQVKCANVLLLLIIAELALMAFDVERLKSSAAPDHMTAYNIFTAIPIIQVILARMAVSGIKKDEALVRSADRLR